MLMPKEIYLYKVTGRKAWTLPWRNGQAIPFKQDESAQNLHGIVAKSWEKRQCGRLQLPSRK